MQLYDNLTSFATYSIRNNFKKLNMFEIKGICSGLGNKTQLFWLYLIWH